MARLSACLLVVAACTGRAEPEPTLPGGPDLEPEMVRVVYASESERQLHQRTWDSDTRSWTPASPVLNTVDPVSWVLLDRSQATGEELVIAFEALAGTARLRVGRRDAEGWHDEWSEPARAQQPRGFDLAFTASGAAVVVFATEPAGLAFRQRPAGGDWSAAAPVPGVAAGSVVHWVVLESRPAVDELALVYLTADVRLEALLWDGNAWDLASAATLENGEMAAIERTRAFDVAYENLSGDLVVLWGHINDPENLVRYALKPADTVDWPVVEDDGSVTSQIARLASEPGSDRIASVGAEGYGDDDVGGMIWDGSYWGERIDRIDNTASDEDHVLAVAWLGVEGAVAAIYEDASVESAGINWATWSAGGWNVEDDLPLPTTEITAVEMATVRGIHGAIGFVSTPDGTSGGATLYAATFQLGAAELSNGGAPLTTTLPGLPGQPFDLIVR